MALPPFEQQGNIETVVKQQVSKPKRKMGKLSFIQIS